MDGRDDPAGEDAAGSIEHDPAEQPRPEDGAVELQDASLAEPPPPAPEARDGFDPVDTTVERDVNYQAFQQRARLAEDRLAEVLTGYRQLKKETEEHKVRITRNTERRFEQRHERLMLKFIDILDNLDRALDSAESTYAGESLIQGLILVRTQLLQTLKDEGLERIPVLGSPYDPHVSESIGSEPVADQEQDHVVLKELMRGYRLNGRVARAGRVVIGTWQPAAPGPPSDAATEPSPEETAVAPADAPREGDPES
jgi:molecular chaperone GrpE